ncbi:MAG: hypothetical protein WDO15_29310 [Bacteroidota bacterium]
MRQIFLIALLIGAVATMANAQLLDSKGEKVHAYYISFDASSSHVEDIRGEFIHIAYRDRIGKSETIKFAVYNFKMELVKELSLVKEFGQNYFDIQLADHGISMEPTMMYYCKLKNEYDETSQRAIRYTAKTEKRYRGIDPRRPEISRL